MASTWRDARRGARGNRAHPDGGGVGSRTSAASADPVCVTDLPSRTAARRAPRPEARPCAGCLRRLGAALRAGLYRPLAEDDDRVAYWVRHVRYGVLLSEVSAATVFGYVLLTTSAGHDNPVPPGPVPDS